MKKSIIIYADCIAIVEELTDEQAGKLFRAILSYINEEPVTEIQGDPAVSMAYKVIKNQINQDIKKYEAKCEKQREKAQKRWKSMREVTEECDRIPKDANVCHGMPRHTNECKRMPMDYDNDINKSTNVDYNNNVKNKATKVAMSPSGDDAIDYAGLVSYFNATLKKYNSVIPTIRDIKGKRKDAVRARVRERGKKSLATVFEKAAASDFLNGKNDRGFFATFDWVICPNNFIKVLEGNYDNRNNNGTANRQNNGAAQRANDAADIVARLAAEDDAAGK